MKKLLFLILLIAPLIGSAQVFRQYFELPDSHTRFGVILPYGQLIKVRVGDSATLYQLNHKSVALTDSMTTMIRNHWAVPVSTVGIIADTIGWNIVNKSFLYPLLALYQPVITGTQTGQLFYWNGTHYVAIDTTYIKWSANKLKVIKLSVTDTATLPNLSTISYGGYALVTDANGNIAKAAITSTTPPPALDTLTGIGYKLQTKYGAAITYEPIVAGSDSIHFWNGLKGWVVPDYNKLRNQPTIPSQYFSRVNGEITPIVGSDTLAIKTIITDTVMFADTNVVVATNPDHGLDVIIKGSPGGFSLQQYHNTSYTIFSNLLNGAAGSFDYHIEFPPKKNAIDVFWTTGSYNPLVYQAISWGRGLSSSGWSKLAEDSTGFKITGTRKAKNLYVQGNVESKDTLKGLKKVMFPYVGQSSGADSMYVKDNITGLVKTEVKPTMIDTSHTTNVYINNTINNYYDSVSNIVIVVDTAHGTSSDPGCTGLIIKIGNDYWIHVATYRDSIICFANNGNVPPAWTSNPDSGTLISWTTDTSCYKHNVQIISCKWEKIGTPDPVSWARSNDTLYPTHFTDLVHVKNLTINDVLRARRIMDTTLIALISQGANGSAVVAASNLSGAASIQSHKNGYLGEVTTWSGFPLPPYMRWKTPSMTNWIDWIADTAFYPSNHDGYLGNTSHKVKNAYFSTLPTITYPGYVMVQDADGSLAQSLVTINNSLWQHEVVSDAENNFTASFTLASTSVILYNGQPLRSSQWSGAGTSTLSVTVPTRQYDFITIK